MNRIKKILSLKYVTGTVLSDVIWLSYTLLGRILKWVDGISEKTDEKLSFKEKPEIVIKHYKIVSTNEDYTLMLFKNDK